ncbi:hypothetical protein LCGC14_0653230 [marine sediment metagenome]|uniref:Uncharacterized protein n=1 Tax=marine sediment metagenome TaxID=412755 RepID=A0A0F9THC8_9ZZZZ
MTADEKNSKLHDDAIDAINLLYNDMGVDVEHAKSNIRALIEDLEIKLDALS